MHLGQSECVLIDYIIIIFTQYFFVKYSFTEYSGRLDTIGNTNDQGTSSW